MFGAAGVRERASSARCAASITAVEKTESGFLFTEK
jgi:hypothetical protein